MENNITYTTKVLLQDYEQWLKGFRFMTDEKIATYIDFVKLFIRDAVDFLYAENIIDSLASIARYDQLHHTRYAQLTQKILFSVHYEKTISHLPKSENSYFDRRAALQKLDTFILSKSFQDKTKDIKPASETLISDIRMWRILHETIHSEVWQLRKDIISDIRKEADDFFSRENPLDENKAQNEGNNYEK